MRVIFMGTPEFAVPSLRALIAGKFEIAAVFTQPDRPAGRGQKPHASPVKQLALEHGLEVHQPEKVRGEEHRPLFERFQADFIVVVAYGQILPKWLLSTARIAPVNVHGSLLPKYRGAAPVIWALLNGDRVTGITTMLMEERLDAGPILMKREIEVPESLTAGELAQQLSIFGAEMLVPTLEGLNDHTISPQTQDDTQSTLAPRVVKQQAEIQWDRPARELHNCIRAFNPWPLAYTDYRGKRMQLLRSRVSGPAAQPDVRPGSYVGSTEKGIIVQCGENSTLEILELQPADRRAISGREFANGARLSPGMPLFTPTAATRRL